MEVWTKGGPIEVGGPVAVITLVLICSFILWLIFTVDMASLDENISLADEAEQQWSEYTLPEDGLKIEYHRHATGTIEEPFIVPSASSARRSGHIIMAILPRGVELPSELAYSHGAGKTAGDRARLIIRPTK